MLSRWTDFLTTDGEKAWRNRDAEFENHLETKEAVLALWNQGWECFLKSFWEFSCFYWKFFFLIYFSDVFIYIKVMLQLF